MSTSLSSCVRYTPNQAFYFLGFVDNYPYNPISTIYRLSTDPCEAYLLFIDIGLAACDLAEALNYDYSSWAFAVIDVALQSRMSIEEVVEMTVWSMEVECPLTAELLFSQIV